MYILIYNLFKKNSTTVRKPTILLLNEIILLSKRVWLKYFSATVCACADVIQLSEETKTNPILLSRKWSQL